MVAAVKSLDTAAERALESMRQPPYSLEAEQAVLGGLMLDNTAWSRIASRVTESDFYRQDHRLIFRSICELAEADSGFDAVTLAERLQARNKLDQAGGLAYLAILARDTPTAANVRAYADIVRERSVLRQLIRIGGELAESSYRPDGRSLAEIVDEAQAQIMSVGATRTDHGPRAVSESLGAWHDGMDRRGESVDGITGLRTDFSALDNLTCGLEPGDLVIVAGRPGMGKTTFAMNIAENVSVRRGEPGLVFEMEMSTDALISRAVSSLGGIPLDSIRRGRLEEPQWKRASSASAALAKSRLVIDDTAALSVLDMRARALAVRRRHGLKYIIVDHLQLVASRAENRTQELTKITAGLKKLAKDLGVPVIALSQLNRQLEQRQNKRPTLGDLRESGSIEQDADVIIFLYREARYDPSCPAPNVAEAIVAKQRNGPTDTVLLSYRGDQSHFSNVDPEDARIYSSAQVSRVSHGTSSGERGFQVGSERRVVD